MHVVLPGAIAAALLVSCGSARPSPTVPELAVHYDRCYAHDQQRDVPATLRCIEELAQHGWSWGLEPDHFNASREHPAWKALQRRLDATVPRAERSQLAFTAPAEIVPENVAFDPKTGAFFLGSLPQRKIVRIAGGRATDFASTDLSVLGMKIDAARRTLWAATGKTGRGDKGPSALVAFDVDTGERVARFATDDGRPHFFNDVVITAAEDVYVTDSAGGGVYRVSGRARLDTFLPAGTWSYPNGIALSSDERTLYISHERGTAAVDIATRAHAELPHPPEIPTIGVDGLYFHRGALVAIQNGMGRARIVRWRLDGSRITRLEPLESRSAMLDHPTTGAIAGDRLYYINNFQARRLGPDGVTVLKPLDPVRVLSLPLD